LTEAIKEEFVRIHDDRLQTSTQQQLIVLLL